MLLMRSFASFSVRLLMTFQPTTSRKSHISSADYALFKINVILTVSILATMQSVILISVVMLNVTVLYVSLFICPSACLCVWVRVCVMYACLVCMCLSVRPSIFLSSSWLFACLTVCLPACKSVCLSVRPSVRTQSDCLSVCSSIRSSVCLPVCPFVCLSICPSVCPFIRLSICPYVHSIRPHVNLFIFQSAYVSKL
jgi:hypothetical protein